MRTLTLTLTHTLSHALAHAYKSSIKLFLTGAHAQDTTRSVRAWMTQMSATWTGM